MYVCMYSIWTEYVDRYIVDGLSLLLSLLLFILSFKELPCFRGGRANLKCILYLLPQLPRDCWVTLQSCSLPPGRLFKCVKTSCFASFFCVCLRKWKESIHEFENLVKYGQIAMQLYGKMYVIESLSECPPKNIAIIFIVTKVLSPHLCHHLLYEQITI